MIQYEVGSVVIHEDELWVVEDNAESGCPGIHFLGQPERWASSVPWHQIEPYYWRTWKANPKRSDK